MDAPDSGLGAKTYCRYRLCRRWETMEISFERRQITLLAILVLPDL
jgi:hypothetical protein